MPTKYIRNEYDLKYYEKLRGALEEYEKGKREIIYDSGRTLELKFFTSVGITKIGFGIDQEYILEKNPNFFKLDREANFLKNQIERYIIKHKNSFLQDVKDSS
jgi:hypothetical protein